MSLGTEGSVRPGSVSEPNWGVSLITVYGVLALGFMLLMYALERRGRTFVLAFALGCPLSSVYGFLSGAWPFGIVEAIWCVVALQRFRTSRVGVSPAQL